MPWAIFRREFNWSRPNSKFSFNVKPSPKPQLRPRDVIDAAVASGAAEAVPTPTLEERRRLGLPMPGAWV